MSEQQDDLFDFGDDLPPNGDKVDSTEHKVDTNATKVAPKKTTRRSGKKSGKTTGSVSRQQKRVPMYQRQPLAVSNKDPNFEYRIVNDVPGRVERLEVAGWVVDTSTEVGDKYAGQASSMGSATSKPVGKGTNGVVMKIPKELYDEDQEFKQREVDRTEEQMLENAAEEINKAAGGRDEWRGEIKIDQYAKSQ